MTRQTRTPQQRAEERLGVAQRHLERLGKERARLQAALDALDLLIQAAWQGQVGPIAGTGDDYWVSNSGEVTSLKWGKCRRIKLTPDGSGYLKFHAHTETGERTIKVHVEVARIFLGPRPPGMVTRHLDGNQHNNSVSNLKYGTPAENNADVLRHGHHQGANKTHCPRNHPYDAENTAITRTGGRRCRACWLEHSRAYKARQAMAANPDLPQTAVSDSAGSISSLPGPIGT